MTEFKKKFVQTGDDFYLDMSDKIYHYRIQWDDIKDPPYFKLMNTFVNKHD
jgi:sortase (surface protein transpeptidase)